MKAPNCFISASYINNSYGFVELPFCVRIHCGSHSFLAPAEAAPVLLQRMVVGVPSPPLQDSCLAISCCNYLKNKYFFGEKKNLKGILGNGGVKLFWTQNSSPQWWSTLRNCKLSVGVMVNSNSSKSCKKCPIIQMNELASQQRGNWAASAFSEDVQNLPQAAPGFGAKAEHQDSQGRWQRCPFVPSIQSQLLSVQIWEPFPVFYFHLGEVHSKLFPWYRNSEHSLKNSEILQFTLLWQILYFVSSFHGIPSLF